MLTKAQLLEPLAQARTDQVVVTTMGTVRPWAEHSHHELDFASADSAMGHAADFALGIAMAQPQRTVICLNGDGSMLMTLGTLVTIVQSGVTNLIVFVVSNGTYEITGNQPIPGASFIDIVGMARAAGFRRAYSFSDADIYRDTLGEILTADGPVLVAALVEAGSEPPISRGDHESAPYLNPSLADCAQRLRANLLGVQ